MDGVVGQVGDGDETAIPEQIEKIAFFEEGASSGAFFSAAAAALLYFYKVLVQDIYPKKIHGTRIRGGPQPQTLRRR